MDIVSPILTFINSMTKMIVDAIVAVINAISSGVVNIINSIGNLF